uniref:Uncharacterized protein n=2 Tax=Sipha flava TaxID=143950 RepID=A0A2S2QYG4_9HEMI
MDNALEPPADHDQLAISNNNQTGTTNCESTIAIENRRRNNNQRSSRVVSKDFNEDIAEPIESENSFAATSYIRRIGRIYRQAFIREVIYPLCFNITLNI